MPNPYNFSGSQNRDNMSSKDRRVFNVLFDSEAAGLAIKDYEERNFQKKLLKRLGSSMTAPNIIIDLDRFPSKFIKNQSTLETLRNTQNMIIKTLETGATSLNKDTGPFVPYRSKINQASEMLKIAFDQNRMAANHAPFYILSAIVKRASLQHDLINIYKKIKENDKLNFQELLRSNNINKKEIEIMDDLKKAVDLALPVPVIRIENGYQVPHYEVSKQEATTLQEAYLYSALLLLVKASIIEKSMSYLNEEDPEKDKLRAIKNRYEETSSYYMSVSGGFGSHIGKQLAEKINPYAKLCGNTVMNSILHQFAGVFQE